VKIQSGKTAFSFIELSVVIIIIGILAVAIVSGKRMISNSTLASAQSLTKNSTISSIPDLALWLEPTLTGSITGAITGNELSDNNPISAWNDILSGSKISLTQATSINQPAYLVSGINSLPSIRFDGSSDVLYTVTPPISAGSGTYTLVAVWRQIALSDDILMEQKSAGTVANKSAAIYLDTANLRFTGYSNQTATSLATLVAGQTYISIMAINNSDANNVRSYLNSNTAIQTNTASPSSLSVGNDFLSVGARISSAGSYNRYASVYFSEILIFNRNLKPLEVTLINNYLSKKYNITVS
jgi:prepilin-type N-terminal cleavage/methylation domain-containing protein